MSHLVQRLAGLRVGYVPYSPSLDRPGDRRRFVHYARSRGIPFEVADPSRVYDLVVVSGNADLSVWARYPHGKVVFDFIDSYLAAPRTPRNLARGLVKFVARQSRRLQLDHWNALRRMCQRSAAVVCSTLEQAASIRPSCANTHVILDIQDADVADRKRDYTRSAPFRLVWEGLPENVHTLGVARDALREVDANDPLQLHLVTDARFPRWAGRFGHADTLAAARRAAGIRDIVLHPWSPASLAAAACAADLAIIPLPRQNPFYWGKPENKLLLFWRMSVPVLVTDSPANARAMAGAELTGTCPDAGWADRLRQMMADESLRRRSGESGHAFATSHHGATATLAAWDAMFESLGF